MAVQTDEFEPGLAEDPVDGVRRRAVRDREAELLALRTRTDLGVRARLDAGQYADHHPLGLGPLHLSGDPGRLAGRVDDDPADAEAQRRAQVLGGLGVAVQHDPLGREATGGGQPEFTRGADVESEAFLLHPVDDGPAEERLGGVDDIGAGQRPPPRPRAGPHLVLVQDVDRGAVAVGQFGEPDPGHGDVATGREDRGRGPDARRVQLTDQQGRFGGHTDIASGSSGAWRAQVLTGAGLGAGAGAGTGAGR